MKVLMIPGINDTRKEGGIGQVINAYYRYLPEFDIELVDKDATSFDVLASHAGATTEYGSCKNILAITHGLYWTADYDASDAEYQTNARVIHNIRHAKEVTVPSSWVAETFQRDMRFSPHVIPHGIEWGGWQHEYSSDNYILWNKNRPGDVCSPEIVKQLAERLKGQRFLTTFAPQGAPPNVRTIGVQPHHKMKEIIQRAGIYLATTKETFGIGILEAMAAGIPVVGFAHGGILDLVEHATNGYLAAPGNIADLTEGIAYCLANRKILGDNGREMAKAWKWELSCEKMAHVMELVLRNEPPTVGIVIPTYNYGQLVGNAIESAMDQTYTQLTNIVVVDDGTEDEGLTKRTVEEYAEKDARVKYVKQPNRGVAVARNNGITHTDTKYVCCLDADDAIASNFLEQLVPVLESDNSVGVVYSNLYLLWPDGKRRQGSWPGECNFDNQVLGKNQVPTCCVFRREAWDRLRGYRQRYAPRGCGSEDAELWLRIGASGWDIKRATDERLFLYMLGGNTTGNKNYKEPDWTSWHPWTADRYHPFASIATPEKHSHPVRQYDTPSVSVVIPVGPGHEKHVVDALDSLEAQTFRKWEAIVVWDSKNRGMATPLEKAYPYVKWVWTDGETGASHARNEGAKQARAPFLLFLDADDWLLPEFMSKCLFAFSELDGDAAIYTDHFGIAAVDNPANLSAELQSQIREWDGHEAIIEFYTPQYNWNRAVRQPQVLENRTGVKLDKPYIWNTITTLIPTAWHFAVGGFDEDMVSWEDWDYWIRMARQGRCFVRLPEPLMVYRLQAGHRRVVGLDTESGLWLELASHMHHKYGKEGEPIMCRNCGNKAAKKNPAQRQVIKPPGTYEEMVEATLAEARGTIQVVDGKVLCKYIRQMRGEHSVYGAATREFYGYRKHGEVFEVDENDIRLAPHWFEPIIIGMEPGTRETPTPVMMPRQRPPTPPPAALRNIAAASPEEPTMAKPVSMFEPGQVEPVGDVGNPDIAIAPTGEPEVVDEPESLTEAEIAKIMNRTHVSFSLDTVPGINESIANQLRMVGVTTVHELAAMGMNDLQDKISGVGPAKAAIIMEAVNALVGGAR